MAGFEIAIIGMAARFPGARNIDEFWENLKGGVESITFFSDEELEARGVAPEVISNDEYVKAAGILEDIEYFDSYFFEYSPVEAEIMDPQIRFFHQCAWEALDHAGYDTESYRGPIGLYAGSAPNFNWEALARLSGRTVAMGRFAASQSTQNDYMCLKVSYKLNLKGPVFSLYTTCSTSLVAVHLACQGLLGGDCDMALAGGVTITFPQDSGYLYQEGMIWSPDGHCRAFDARARGTIGGNGVGIVVLKRLEDAVDDRDFVHAVIKGSAINNDGRRKVGFTAPSITGQAEVIRAAQQMAGVEPESISYIEAHGTGTPLGDPVEFKALCSAFKTDRRSFCALGAVKTNVGHLDTASGIAGLIKTVLALKYKLIPPTLNFETPAPEIDLENSPFFVNSKGLHWLNEKKPLRAGVSSLGIGGTNAHIILEAAPETIPREVSYSSRRYKLLVMSARTESALRQMTKNLLGYLQKSREVDLADVVYTLQAGRRVFEYRQFHLCKTVEESIDALTSVVDSVSAHREMTRFNSSKEVERPVVFMFPGQGAQYICMGRDLYEREPVFKAEMDRCFDVFHSMKGYDLKEILYPHLRTAVTGSGLDDSGSSHDINQTAFAQPILFIFEYALARLLLNWGIEPTAMIGHSVGEYVAACLAGVFSLEDGLNLISKRGELMQSQPAGAMLAVYLSEEDLKPLLNPGISMAAVNSPRHCVISGPVESINAQATKITAGGHTCKQVYTSHAFHSSMMDPVLKPFGEFVRQIELREPAIPYVSNISGRWINKNEARNPDYWVNHLRYPVRFSDGLEELLKEESSIFIEVGPGRMLLTFARKFQENGTEILGVNCVRHPDDEVTDDYHLLRKIGYLWSTGVRIDWRLFHSRERRYRLPLPAYPFERTYHWPSASLAGMVKNFLSGMPLPGKRQDDAILEEVKDEPSGSVGKESEDTGGQWETAFRDKNMKRVAKIWRKFLGVKGVGPRDDFFEAGGDSLQAMAVVNMIHKTSGVRIPIAFFFSHPYIEDLAGYIADHDREVSIPMIERVEKKEYYSSSPAQRRLFVLHQMEVSSVNYNLPSVFELTGVLNQRELLRSFTDLIGRHDIFRTSFELIDQELVQRIQDDCEFRMEVMKIRETDVGRVMDNFVKPFDLSQTPLLRVALLRLADSESGNRYILIMDIHHTIADGTSMTIMFKELMLLYNKKELPPPIIQYKDYAEWLNRAKNLERLDRQEKYWLRQFEKEVPPLNLPTNFERPEVRSFEGSTFRFEIGEEETIKLKGVTAQEDVTLFMALLTAFYIFLAKLGRVEDIVVGTVINGRNYSDLDQVVGMFVNTLFLRNFPAGEKSFREFLGEVKESVIGAFENQDYPTEALVDKVLVSRARDRYPLTDVGFTMENIDVPEIEIPGLKLKPYPFKNDISRVDLILFAAELGGKLSLKFEYCKSLFDHETIKRFAEYFKEILAQVVENREYRLTEVCITYDLLEAESDVSEINFEL